LDHEVGDDAVDEEVIVVAPLGEGLEVLARLEAERSAGKIQQV
jgi:hypothetical protein